MALTVGAGLVWSSSRTTWSRAVVDGGVRGTIERIETGAQHAPALAPLAFLALAGIAGLIATGGWARRVLSALLMLAGGTAGVLGVRGVVDGSGAHIGPWQAVLGGLLVMAAGVIAFGAARDLPRLGTRYENPRSARRPAEGETDLWKSLSEGRDPTTEE